MKKVVYNVFTMSYGEMSNSSLRNEILPEVRDTLRTLMKYVERLCYDSWTVLFYTVKYSTMSMKL